MNEKIKTALQNLSTRNWKSFDKTITPLLAAIYQDDFRTEKGKANCTITNGPHVTRNDMVCVFCGMTRWTGYRKRASDRWTGLWRI